jgi:hypothetical protein
MMLRATGFLLKRNRNEWKKHRLYSKPNRKDNAPNKLNLGLKKRKLG